jgi:hypothetical protein
MRNHNEKTRDIARSVLPSTARKSARQNARHARKRERANERQLLHDLSGGSNYDDFEGDWARHHRRTSSDMVSDRRSADKVGPLLHWAQRTIERSHDLGHASPEDREVYFRKLLPPGPIGDHAVSHLWWVLEDPPIWATRSRRRPETTNPDIDRVEEIVAAGGHGDLNRRLRAVLGGVVKHTVRLPAERLVDNDHLEPGLLLPPRTVVEYRRPALRFLRGAHDVESFVREAGWNVVNVVRDLQEELKPVQPSLQPRG